VTGEDVKDFVVPDLGEGLEDATITTWSVAIGDDVELNQTICCLETAKAEVEIPSPYAGRIVELNGAEGDVLEVGSLLVRIDTGSGMNRTSQRPPPRRLTLRHPPPRQTVRPQPALPSLWGTEPKGASTPAGALRGPRRPPNL
jgi:pyruvate dehydrogenase E2 component (dihydrolipoamide acetyltransferase)